MNIWRIFFVVFLMFGISQALDRYCNGDVGITYEYKDVKGLLIFKDSVIGESVDTIIYPTLPDKPMPVLFVNILRFSQTDQDTFGLINVSISRPESWIGSAKPFQIGMSRACPRSGFLYPFYVPIAWSNLDGSMTTGSSSVDITNFDSCTKQTGTKDLVRTDGVHAIYLNAKNNKDTLYKPSWMYTIPGVGVVGVHNPDPIPTRFNPSGGDYYLASILNAKGDTLYTGKSDILPVSIRELGRELALETAESVRISDASGRIVGELHRPTATSLRAELQRHGAGVYGLLLHSGPRSWSRLVRVE